MPNQRAENVKRVTVTIDDQLLQKIEDYCKKHGMNRLEFIRLAADKEINRRNADKDRKNKESDK